jgi:uncharacterized membrane protein
LALKGFVADTRAQSIAIMRFFLSLIVGGILCWILWEVTDPILDGASSATTNAKANQATTWFEQAIDWFPLYFLLIAVFGLVAVAVYQRRQAGV